MPSPLLNVEYLTKNFGSINAVRKLSLCLQPGETVGLLGPNGAGKTTTISMLTGLLPRTGGRILFKDREIGENLAGFKSRIGLVPQELALYPSLSARENLLFFGRCYRLRGKNLKNQVDKALSRTGLTARANDLVNTYSTGMKRRINLAAGLLHRPEILFLDEPTVGVDPQARHAIFESIEALKREGVSIVYTTHYMEEAERLCDRVAIIDEGSLIAMDTPQRLIRKQGTEMIKLGLGEGDQNAICEALRALGSVENVRQQENEVIVDVRGARESLLAILTRVQERAGIITSLEILASNLETVFLKLTGKALRD